MRTFVLIFTICFGLLTVVEAESEHSKFESLLLQLDKEIVSASQYLSDKEIKLAKLKDMLGKVHVDLQQRYDVARQLTTAYEYYRCDSARVYAIMQLQLAETIGREEWIIDSKIQLASILSKAAMFDASLRYLEDLSDSQLSDSQQIAFYKTYYETHVYWIDYYEDGYADASMTAGRDFYYEQFLQAMPKNSYDYITYNGIKQINEGKLEAAEKVLQLYLPNAQLGTRTYSILNSVLAYLYGNRKNTEMEGAHLALSAISDVRGNIMENASLRELAVLLYEAGDLERANRYILKSMEDANFYNARIRNFQTLRVLQVVNKAYEANQYAQQQKLKRQLGVISLLSLILMAGIIIIVRQVRKVSKAKRQVSLFNEELKEKNAALAEANHIKEEYIGHFLALCSLYIEKLDKYRKKLFHKAKTGNTDALIDMIKSSKFIDEERADFYEKFDDSFLQLFPDFVKRFNDLFPDGEQVILKPSEKLTTELRIFALIRLGINDSNKIAEFLNYSLATIYNYRSRYRNKSIIPREEFEGEIMKIGKNQL